MTNLYWNWCSLFRGTIPRGATPNSGGMWASFFCCCCCCCCCCCSLCLSWGRPSSKYPAEDEELIKIYNWDNIIYLAEHCCCCCYLELAEPEISERREFLVATEDEHCQDLMIDNNWVSPSVAADDLASCWWPGLMVETVCCLHSSDQWLHWLQSPDQVLQGEDRSQVQADQELLQVNCDQQPPGAWPGMEERTHGWEEGTRLVTCLPDPCHCHHWDDLKHDNIINW